MVDVARPTASSSSLEKTLQGLKPEEIDKFQTKFKDPKFMELFAEYARDLADPKYRAESEQYLRQLEQEGRSQEVYGQDTQLVAPDPSFVAKTANKQSGQKIFINVCTSDKVKVATSKRVPTGEGSTAKGMHWQIPTLLGKCKEGSDRNQIQCWVLDFVIHPDTCRMAMNNARFKSMVMDTATDLIEKQQGWTLTRQYSFPKLTYKVTEDSARPQVLSIKQDRSDSASEAAQGPQLGVADLAAGSSSANTSQSAGKASDFKFPSGRGKIKAVAAGSRAGQSQASSKADSDICAAPDSLTTAGYVSKADRSNRTESGDDELMTAVATTRMQAIDLGCSPLDLPEPSSGSECAEPQHELVYRGQVDLADAWEGPGSKSVPTRYPKELLVRVKLPGLQQANQAQLGVKPRHLTVSVPYKYHLHLSLPYTVTPAEGRASFNAAKQQLEVVLPVVPTQTSISGPALLPLQAQAQLQQQQSDHQSDMASSSTSGANAQDPSLDELIASSSDLVSSSSVDAAIHSRCRRGVTDQSGAEQQHQVAVIAGSSAEQQTKQMPELTQNQRRWHELHQPPSSIPPVGTARVQPAISTAVQADTVNEHMHADALLQAAASGQDFVPCPRFVQHLPGYVFAKRDTGLGYHKDTRYIQPKERSADVPHRAVQSKQPAVKYLLRPRLVSLAAADELD